MVKKSCYRSDIKPVVNYLHMEPVSSGVFAATNDWGDSEATSQLKSRIEKASKEFIEALLSKEKVTAYDAYAIGDIFS